MRYGNPDVAGGARPAARGRLRPHPRRAAVSAVRGEHDRVGDRRGPRARRADAPDAGIALRRLLPRRSGLRQGARARRSTTTGCGNGRPDRLVMSFHGLPRRSLDLGDPYHCHCHKTARLLAAELGLDAEAVRGHLPVALRPRRVAAALHAGHRGRAGEGGGPAGRRRLPRLRRRLPRDAGGDRHRGAGTRSSRPGARSSTRFPASTRSRR